MSRWTYLIDLTCFDSWLLSPRYTHNPPVVEEGGYIPLCDHRVPPDVSLENHMHYVRTVRTVWGKNTDLKPMHPEAEALRRARVTETPVHQNARLSGNPAKKTKLNSRRF